MFLVDVKWLTTRRSWMFIFILSAFCPPEHWTIFDYSNIRVRIPLDWKERKSGKEHLVFVEAKARKETKLRRRTALTHVREYQCSEFRKVSYVGASQLCRSPLGVGSFARQSMLMGVAHVISQRHARLSQSVHRVAQLDNVYYSQVHHHTSPSLLRGPPFAAGCWVCATWRLCATFFHVGTCYTLKKAHP